MKAGHVACPPFPPPVSHVECEPSVLLRLEKDGTNGRTLDAASNLVVQPITAGDP